MAANITYAAVFQSILFSKIEKKATTLFANPKLDHPKEEDTDT